MGKKGRGERKGRRGRATGSYREPREERLRKPVAAGEHSPHATVLVLNQPDWTPFAPTDERERDGAMLYENSRYIVAVYPPELPFEGWPLVVHLSFKHVLNVAITDFRDFQKIKNELVWPEAYTVQIFPPESSLVDTANQYHLFVFVPNSWPDVEEGDEWPQLPIGFGTRALSETPPHSGRQRTFDPEHRPENMEEEEAHMREMYAKAKAIKGEMP